MCIFYILKDTQTLSFLFPRKQPPNPFQLSSEQFSFHYAKMITIIQKVLPGRITSLSENNALKSIIYNYLFSERKWPFFPSLFCQLRSRSFRTFSAKHVGLSKLTFLWVLSAFMTLLGKERSLPNLPALFMTTVIVWIQSLQGSLFTHFFPTRRSSLSLKSQSALPQTKESQKKKTPNESRRFQSENKFSKTIAGRMEINQNPLFLAEENICTPINFAQEHCND